MTARAPSALAASVIVPTRGRPKMILECVQSILDGDDVPRELIVVDQSETPNPSLAELGTVRGCRMRYRHSSSHGVSAARNEACAVANEDVLVFTDDDVLVAPDWLGTIVGHVRNDASSTLMSGRVLSVDTSGAGGYAPSLIDDEEPRVYEGRIWNDVLFSNNMAFTRTIFDRLGPFDPRLGVGGAYLSATDNDYCFRALEAGFRIRYLPDAVVYHQAWRPKKSYRQIQWTYGVGQGATFAKHSSLRDRYTLIRLRNEILRHANRCLRCVRHDRHAATGELAYVIGLLYGSTRWLVRERLRGR